MKITKVCCQGCGADLQVDETVRYVTCNYCHARLEVVHDPSVTHTRLMEKLEQNTERMAGNLKVIELQNELERLDREWESQKETYMVTGKHGHRYLPSEAGSMIGGGMMVVVGIAWATLAAGIGAPGPLPLFGLLVIGLGIYSMATGTSKASRYRTAEAGFLQLRNAIIQQIDEARRS